MSVLKRKIFIYFCISVTFSNKKLCTHGLLGFKIKLTGDFNLSYYSKPNYVITGYTKVKKIRTKS